MKNYKTSLKYFIVLFFMIAVGWLLVSDFNFNQAPSNKTREETLTSDYTEGVVQINGVSINVDLAENTKEQEQGLSGRAPLLENQGMLFVFDKSDEYYFWMKEMNFSIDIIWFDENQKIVYIQENANPESYPVLFGSKQNSKYVLEVSAGFVAKNNLKIGDSFQF